MSTVSSAVTFTITPSSVASPKVLVFRSCRPHVLEEALRSVRAAWPDAAISALSHRGHAATLKAKGIDDTLEVPGTRFGLFRTPWRILRELRGARFDAVVVPQMTATGFGHTNLYLLALATGAHALAVFDPDFGLRWHSRRELGLEILRHWPACLRRRLDVPAALFLMTLALVWPRRRSAKDKPRPGRTKVLHVITSWGVGGAQRQLAELVSHAPSELEAEILVLSRGDGDFSSQHLSGRNVRIRYARRWPMLGSTIREIASLCRSERYDVVHTWLLLANVLGVAGARLGSVPHVISSVRNLSLWKRTWARRPWFRLAETLASRASDIVTVNAAALVPDHAEWARIAPARIDVVPNGLAPDGLTLDVTSAQSALRERLNIGADVRLVGTVGRLAPEKDHALLLDAWTQVIGTVRDAHLVIVGDGALRAALETRIAAERLPVTLIGESGNARQVIAGLDLFVLPSRIEGFANVLLEATMLGIPVVATDVGAARDVVVNDDDLVPVGDANCLATRLVGHLIDLSGPRTRAVPRQRFVRTTFTVDRMVERWLSLYARS